jgi:hypothetical protein
VLKTVFAFCFVSVVALVPYITFESAFSFVVHETVVLNFLAVLTTAVMSEITGGVVSVGGGGGTGFTETFMCCVTLPPAPVQVSVKVLLFVRFEIDSVPLVFFVPVHALLALHEVASVLDQMSVMEPPEVMVDVLTLNERVGAGVGGGVVFTVRVTLFVTFPPAPVQVSAYVLVVCGEVENVPLVAFVPAHAPLAVQSVAFVVLHVSTVLCPAVIVVGFPVNMSVGVGVVVELLTVCVSVCVVIARALSMNSIVKTCVPGVSVDSLKVYNSEPDV